MIILSWYRAWTFTLRLNRRTRLLPYKLNLRLFFLLSKIRLFRHIRLILTFKSSGPLREKIMYIPCISKIITNLGINLLEYFIIKSLISLKKWSSLFQFFVYIQTLAQLISKCRNHSSRKKCLLIVTLKDLHIFSPLLILQRRKMSIFFFFFFEDTKFSWNKSSVKW